MNAALRHPAIPIDVRWMNRLSIALLVAGTLGAGVYAASKLLLRPELALTHITVLGDVAHNNVVTIQANVATRLHGNFYTLDLAQARAAFEAVPWVRRALVRREFPNRLKVVLQEHQPVAYWGPEDEPRLLNNFGEVFEANVDDVEAPDLPRLSGPDAESAQVLGMYRAMKTSFQMLGMGLEALDLSSRGSWRIELDSGAVIEVGTGGNDEVLHRLQRFVSTLTQVSSQHGLAADALLGADLRYPQGYALRLRGIGTVSGNEPESASKK